MFRVVLDVKHADGQEFSSQAFIIRVRSVHAWRSSATVSPVTPLRTWLLWGSSGRTEITANCVMGGGCACEVTGNGSCERRCISVFETICKQWHRRYNPLNTLAPSPPHLRMDREWPINKVTRALGAPQRMSGPDRFPPFFHYPLYFRLIILFSRSFSPPPPLLRVVSKVEKWGVLPVWPPRHRMSAQKSRWWVLNKLGKGVRSTSATLDRIWFWLKRIMFSTYRQNGFKAKWLYSRKVDHLIDQCMLTRLWTFTVIRYPRTAVRSLIEIGQVHDGYDNTPPHPPRPNFHIECVSALS